MDNIKTYKKIFIDVLQIDDKTEELNNQYRDIGWDSVSHMLLVSEIENAFDIMLDTDDVIDFSSFEKGKEILKKYEIEF